MRILYYASVDFFSKPNPSFHLMYSMISDLISAGHTVHLVGCSDPAVQHHIPEEFKKNPLFTYKLVQLKTVQKSAFVRRYLEGIRLAFRTSKFLSCADEYDIVFVQSSPTVLYNLYFVRKYAREARIVYNIQDMFPGSSIASGVMTTHWMQKVFYWLQKKAYRKADCITVISEDMKRKVLEQGVPEGKIHVIMNWFDDHTVQEVKWEENRFVKKYCLSRDIFYVQYAGTVGYVIDYDAFLYAAKKLKDNRHIRFQIIAQGSCYRDFTGKAQADKLDNIDFLPIEPQDMVSDVYSACSVCLIPLKKQVIGNSVPSKAGLLMACRRAVINSVDEDSCYFKEFNDNKIGISVPNSDHDALVSAIELLYENPELRCEMAERAYQYGKTLYSRRYNMEKYLSLFHQLSSTATGSLE